MPHSKTARGWILVPQAATLSHLDGSTVVKWCGRSAAEDLFHAELVQDPEDLRTRWHIERASFLRWVRARRAC